MAEKSLDYHQNIINNIKRSLVYLHSLPYSYNYKNKRVIFYDNGVIYNLPMNKKEIAFYYIINDVPNDIKKELIHNIINNNPKNPSINSLLMMIFNKLYKTVDEIHENLIFFIYDKSKIININMEEKINYINSIGG
jgi:hypothetical protein